jgi:hypothetical protein
MLRDSAGPEECSPRASGGCDEVETPLAEVPYSFRQAGVSLWIKAGVDPVEVARPAGHSVAVLFRFYAKILRGVQDHANELIGKALADQGR